MTLRRLLAAFFVAGMVGPAVFANGQELLTNPGVEIATSPEGWDLDEFATDPSITELVNSAQSIGFANQEEGGSSGLWLRPFVGAQIGTGAELVNAVLSQTVPGTPCENYTFSGFSQFEQNYSGGVATLDPLSVFGAIPSPTQTTFEIEFLDGGGSTIGSPTVLDLRNEQFNGFGWLDHSVSAVAPAGTANVRVTAAGRDMAPNINPGQSAFVDTFSLTTASAPGVELLTNENLEVAADAPPGWERLEGEGTTARYEGFASRTGANGLWIAPRGADVEPLDAKFAQTLPATVGGEYEFSGWSFWEPSYAGGVETLNAESPFGAIPSDTETYYFIEFLDGAGDVVETTQLDLSTVQSNDRTWREHSVSATAPEGAVDIRVGVLAESLRFNRIPEGDFDDAYFDDFSLSLIVDDPLAGDANGDGSVDLLDLDILGSNFGTMGGATFGDGDFNGDGNVDLLDLDVLGANFGATADAVAVPEPAAMALLVSLVLLRRRS
ncbi:MAG: hypothetical protein AAF266_06835 [Planctomycetota bacterium]